MKLELELPDLPDEIAHAKGQATWLLYYGPSGGGCDMTFEQAINVLSEWAGHISDGFFDEDGYPQSFEDFEAGDTCQVDRRIIIHQYLGRDLAPYVL